MINANELRIGNWVHHSKEWSSINNGPFDTPGFDFQWEERHWYMIGECTLSPDIVDPIPITSEWLVRFGFTNESAWFFRNDKMVIETFLSKNEWAARIRTSEESSTYLCQIKYIHQLQNLFYYITNTELTLN